MAGILEGKVALITGADRASDAPPRKFSHARARNWCSPTWSRTVATQTLAMVADTGGEADLHQDRRLECRRCRCRVAKAVATYGRLDCAFNNAGIEGAKASPTNARWKIGIASSRST